MADVLATAYVQEDKDIICGDGLGPYNCWMMHIFNHNLA